MGGKLDWSWSSHKLLSRIILLATSQQQRIMQVELCSQNHSLSTDIINPEYTVQSSEHTLQLAWTTPHSSLQLLPLPITFTVSLILTGSWRPRWLSRHTPAVCLLQPGTSHRTAPALWPGTRDRAPDCPYSRSGRFLVCDPGILAALWSHWLVSEGALGSLSCARSGWSSVGGEEQKRNVSDCVENFQDHYHPFYLTLSR